MVITETLLPGNEYLNEEVWFDVFTVIPVRAVVLGEINSGCPSAFVTFAIPSAPGVRDITVPAVPDAANSRAMFAARALTPALATYKTAACASVSLYWQVYDNSRIIPSR
jgi:hypothetical protein